jgi:hypothetical protein
MAGLQADQLNEEFLKTFINETIYLVPEDAAVPAVETPAVPVIPVKASEPAAVTKSSVNKSTPALPKPEKTVSAPATPVQTEKYTVIGENKKGVVVLVTLPDADFRKLPQLQLLQKMLSSIGFQPDDVAYVNNISKKDAIFEELQQLLNVKYIISFASRLNTALPHDRFTLYNPVKVAGVPVVFSQSFEILEQDVEHKRKLWIVFQQVFL